MTEIRSPTLLINPSALNLSTAVKSIISPESIANRSLSADAEPLKVPAGSKIVATFTFDNSTRNPANPDAKRTVPWGDQSFDEMLYTAIRYRWVDETAAHQLPQYEAALKDSQLLGMLDDNLDGKLQMSELKGQIGAGLKASFAALDSNKDGVLDATELTKAMGMMQGRQASN